MPVPNPWYTTRCSFGCYSSLQRVFPFSKTTLWDWSWYVPPYARASSSRAAAKLSRDEVQWHHCQTLLLHLSHRLSYEVWWVPQIYVILKVQILHEDNLPVGEVTTQARLHQGYIDSSIMRIIHEIHRLVTPYSPDILFQEERLSNIYQAFSPQEYNVLRNNLGLATVNKHLDLEKAMKTIQWFKETTCPCHNHAVWRGGRN